MRTKIFEEKRPNSFKICLKQFKATNPRNSVTPKINKHTGNQIKAHNTHIAKISYQFLGGRKKHISYWAQLLKTPQPSFLNLSKLTDKSAEREKQTKTVGSKHWEFPRFNPKLAPLYGGQGETEQKGRFNQQGNLQRGLPWGATRWVDLWTPPARILSLYRGLKWVYLCLSPKWSQ